MVWDREDLNMTDLETKRWFDWNSLLRFWGDVSVLKECYELDDWLKEKRPLRIVSLLFESA